MKTTLFFVCLISGILTLTYCKKKSTTSVYKPTCNGTKSFQNDVKPLINSSCNISGCHSTYSTYAQISGSASSIRSVVADGSMPRNSTLSNAQKDIILCWIDSGSPNN